MEEKEIINYDKATFSLAIIDFKSYTATIMSLDEQLKESNDILDYVLNHKEQAENYFADMCREISFAKYAHVQKYLESVKKSIMRYQNKLKKYLEKNPTCQEEFNAQMDILIPLLEEKEKFVNTQIKRCFEYLNSLINTDTASV